jgi:hypothetical protein
LSWPVIEYAAVRASLDWSLDDETLPEDIIKLDKFEGVATRWVESQLSIVPPTGNSELAALNAKVAYTAYLLVRGMPNITDEREFFARQGYTRQPIDVDALSAFLLNEAQGFIDVANGVSATAVGTIPTYFTLANGYRGR